MPRFHLPFALQAQDRLALPAGVARHVQVLRLQPGSEITLFDGRGGEWRARIAEMGRSNVVADVLEHQPIEREAVRTVHLAVGLMASERMDWLIEKATELGAASLTPLLMARSSLRLAGDSAARKQARWQAIAVAACEQCGRNRVPTVHPLLPWSQFIALQHDGARWLLSTDAGAPLLGAAVDNLPASHGMTLLSGPEGGFSPDEQDAAGAAGFAPLSLGPRVLRAETAPLAALARLSCHPPTRHPT